MRSQKTLRHLSIISFVLVIVVSLYITLFGSTLSLMSTVSQAEEPQAGELQANTFTRYPIVFAHGFNASPQNKRGFNPDLINTLKQAGHSVYATKVARFNRIRVRAEQLQQEIDAILLKTGQPKVNIIAHSMGGLDSRYLIHHLGFENKIASLTTISTPHRGTPIADMLYRPSGGIDYLLTQFKKLLDEGTAMETRISNIEFENTLLDLSQEQSEVFNQTTPDHPNVYYQSWAGLSNIGGIAGPHDVDLCHTENHIDALPVETRDRMDPLLVPMSVVIANGLDFIPNDGVVTVESAKWGHFRGCLLADHFDEVGQVNDQGTDLKSGFNYIQFYRDVIHELARKHY